MLEKARTDLVAGRPVVLMVSGGSDSTALACWAAQLRDAGQLGPATILHVNHRLRGADADGDETFVRLLADALALPFTCITSDVAAIAREEGGNVEAVARLVRYEAAADALTSLCAQEGTGRGEGCIVTAHTADDRVENFYMRSIVGTGPGGFRSMDEVSSLPNGMQDGVPNNAPNGACIVRPFLHCSRTELRDYLQKRAASGLPCVRDDAGNLWREDATNAEIDRFRTFVRHEIIPRAKERNPQLLDTLSRTMDLIADEDDYLAEQAREAAESYVTRDGEARILAPGFDTLPLVVQRRVAFSLLEGMLDPDARVEYAAVAAVLDAFEDGAPISGYVTNIQGNLAVSANKRGVRIEPMAAYRTRRNRS